MNNSCIAFSSVNFSPCFVILVSLLYLITCTNKIMVEVILFVFVCASLQTINKSIGSLCCQQAWCFQVRPPGAHLSAVATALQSGAVHASVFLAIARLS